MFDRGKLHNAPFTMLHRSGYGYFFSNMRDGRPGDGTFITSFYPTDSWK